MKKIKYFIVSLSLLGLIFSSCKDENPYTHGYGEATAIKNGEEWMANISGALENDKILILIDKYNENNFLRESLGIGGVPNELGTYSISNDIYVTYTTSLDDGDVSGDTYDLINGSFENKIEITRLEGDKIWGTYQLTIAKRTNIETERDTISFTDGEFFTKIFD